MTDIENILKGMSLRKPGAGLDERIGRMLIPSGRPPVHPLRSPIPVWAALAACLVFGFLGYFLRTTHEPGATEIVRTFYVLESNPFSTGFTPDQSSTATIYPINTFKVTIIGAEGNGA